MTDDLQSTLASLCEQVQRLQARLNDVRFTRPTETTETPVPVQGAGDSSRVHTFDSPDADLVLKSSDGVEFRVFKQILAQGSKFFQTMFTLPSESNTTTELPVIDLAENSQLISSLLQFLYPIPDPSIQSLDDLNHLIAVVIKYDMPGVLHSLRRLLISHDLAAVDPFVAYTIAVRHQLPDEVKITAARTFSVSLLDMPLTDDHKYITGFEFFQLIKLHRKRAKDFIDVIKGSGSLFRCPGCSRRTNHSANWWQDWETRACVEIQKRPCTKIVFSPAFVAKSAKAAVENQTPCLDCPMHMHSSQHCLETLRMRLDSIAIIL